MSSPCLPIRGARPEDAAAIAALEQRCGPSTWSEAAVRTSLRGPGGLGCVLPDPDGLLGHALARVGADEADVLAVAVHPAHRRRGLGNALLATLEATMIRAGVRRAFLEVQVDNPAARALYIRRGWRTIGRRERYYEDDSDAALLRWMAP